MKTVKVISRLGEIEGFASEEVACFDKYDPKAGKVVRHFILLDENIKLMHEPWGWENQWYADLIDIKYVNSSEIEIKDLFIDIIIEGNGPTYRMIDFEDVIEALKSKKIEIEELELPFKKLQQFLDNHLHKGKDFPPSIIRPFMSK